MKAEEFIKSFLIVDKNDLSNTGVPFYSYPKHQVHEAIKMARDEVKNKALISFCKSICQDKPKCSNYSTPNSCKRCRNFMNTLEQQLSWQGKNIK